MPTSSVVVMGASAGGIAAASAAIAGLPRSLPASVLVVIHTGIGDGNLADVLGRTAVVPVEAARDGARLEAGHVYVARPDKHLVVDDGRMRVVSGPRENGFRPAVDTLFISAARAAGPRVAGVILSGALSDGVAGLRAIKSSGGRAIVQNPEQAVFPSMPLSALREVEVDAVLLASEIPGDLTAWAAGRFAATRKDARRPVPQRRGASTARASGDRGPAERHDKGGGRDRRAQHELVPISCPSCGGALSQTSEPGPIQYECHVGHRFNADSLAAVLDDQVEDVLWTAVRALQEKALLRRRMQAGIASPVLAKLSDQWLEEAFDAQRQAEQIRSLIAAVPPRVAEAAGASRARAARRAPPSSRSAASRQARVRGAVPRRPAPRRQD